MIFLTELLVAEKLLFNTDRMKDIVVGYYLTTCVTFDTVMRFFKPSVVSFVQIRQFYSEEIYECDRLLLN